MSVTGNVAGGEGTQILCKCTNSKSFPSGNDIVMKRHKIIRICNGGGALDIFK